MAISHRCRNDAVVGGSGMAGGSDKFASFAPTKEYKFGSELWELIFYLDLNQNGGQQLINS